MVLESITIEKKNENDKNMKFRKGHDVRATGSQCGKASITSELITTLFRYTRSCRK